MLSSILTIPSRRRRPIAIRRAGKGLGGWAASVGPAPIARVAGRVGSPSVPGTITKSEAVIMGIKNTTTIAPTGALGIVEAWLTPIPCRHFQLPDIQGIVHRSSRQQLPKRDEYGTHASQWRIHHSVRSPQRRSTRLHRRQLFLSPVARAGGFRIGLVGDHEALVLVLRTEHHLLTKKQPCRPPALLNTSAWRAAFVSKRSWLEGGRRHSSAGVNMLIRCRGSGYPVPSGSCSGNPDRIATLQDRRTEQTDQKTNRKDLHVRGPDLHDRVLVAYLELTYFL